MSKKIDEKSNAELAVGTLQFGPEAYKDAVKPMAKELGKSGLTVARAVNAVLLPLKGFVWGAERLEQFFTEEIPKRLEERKVKEVVTPAPSVAVPTISALTYLGGEEELRNLFANLLVSSMDSATASKVHPAFPEIIKQLSRDEARLLAAIAKSHLNEVAAEDSTEVLSSAALSVFEKSTLDMGAVHFIMKRMFITEAEEIGINILEAQQYFDNLLRLRILEISFRTSHRDQRVALEVTPFGIRFLRLCVAPITSPSKSQ